MQLQEARLRPDELLGIRVKRQRAEWARKGHETKTASAQGLRTRWETKALQVAHEMRRKPSYRELANRIAKDTGDNPETIRKHLAAAKILGN